MADIPANHYDSMTKSFTADTVAAGFVAAIQAQLLINLTLIATKEQTFAFRAINAIFTAGLVLDIISAILGYLAIRWLEQLEPADRILLNGTRDLRFNGPGHGRSTREIIYPTWLALSLTIPLPFLSCGILFMLAGMYTYVWIEYISIFAGLITVTTGIVIPFFVGHSFAGWSNGGTRTKVVRRLNEMLRNW